MRTYVARTDAAIKSTFLLPQIPCELSMLDAISADEEMLPRHSVPYRGMIARRNNNDVHLDDYRLLGRSSCLVMKESIDIGL